MPTRSPSIRALPKAIVTLKPFYLVNTSVGPRLPDRTVQYNSCMKDGSADSRTDPKWPELLHLSAHELRAPLSALSGFLRMLKKEFAGPLGDQQRHLLEKAEKSCGYLTALLRELSELSQLESGEATFNRGTVNLKSVLADAIAALPEVPERTVKIVLIADSDPSVDGDALRLKTAFASILYALRRELVTSDELVVQVDARDGDAGRSLRITIGEPNQMVELRQLEPRVLVAFNEWRGGNGLRLPSARRIIEAHGGRVLGQVSEPIDVEPKRSKTTAIITLPSSA
jgi:signal transduction histidine kinase